MVRRVVVGKRKIGRVARDVGVWGQTVRKWVRRYLEEGGRFGGQVFPSAPLAGAV